VRAHGMRAIGCLYSVLPVQRTAILPELLRSNVGLQKLCDEHQQASRLALACAHRLNSSDNSTCNWSEWCRQAAGELCQCMQQGNAKCAWNACIATVQLFSRRWQLKDLVTAADMSVVHAAVVEQLHRSNNFKVRIHAAHAVQVAGASWLPDGAVLKVLLSVVHALRALRCDYSPQQLQESSKECGSSCPGAAAVDNSSASEIVLSVPASTTRGEGVENTDEAPANFKYHAELTMRLTGVLVDFLMALQKSDATALAGDLGWILEFLEEQIGLWSVGTAPSDPSGISATPDTEVRHACTSRSLHTCVLLQYLYLRAIESCSAAEHAVQLSMLR
jgi:hypothetical protein